MIHKSKSLVFDDATFIYNWLQQYNNKIEFVASMRNTFLFIFSISNTIQHIMFLDQSIEIFKVEKVKTCQYFTMFRTEQKLKTE